jgi:3-hydroxyacyl-CoA dehydrogenase/3a,7a,12a-trihydroxy-5b-cholest-24-enoyl-CoA hydratase
VNTIAPIAGTRMTETVMAKEIVDALKPEYVVPLVAWLCHESCTETGSLFEVGAGYVTKHRFQRTKGHAFDFDTFTPEAVRDNWSKVIDFKDATIPESINDTLSEGMNNVERNQKLKAKKTAGDLKSDEIFSMMA